MYFSDIELHFCPPPTLRMAVAVAPAPSTASSFHSNTAAVAAASLQTGARQMLIRERSERERRVIGAAKHHVRVNVLVSARTRKLRSDFFEPSEQENRRRPTNDGPTWVGRSWGAASPLDELGILLNGPVGIQTGGRS